MRYRLAILMLFAVLPVMNLLAAPAPDPYAILDLGPPPKGETAEECRKRHIEARTFHATLCRVWIDPEVQKLPCFAHTKDGRPWLAKNIRVTDEDGKSRLRFTFRAGTRAEQRTIINSFLRAKLFWQEESLKSREHWLRIFEKDLLDLETRIKSSQNLQETADYQKKIDELRSIRIPETRAEIARLKQFVVIRWAR